jgi:hypothetical protein
MGAPGDGAPSFVLIDAFENAGPSDLHPSDEDLSLGTPIRLPQSTFVDGDPSRSAQDDTG